MKNKFFLTFSVYILFLYTPNILSATITNNGNSAINVVCYANYIPPTTTISAKGRLNKQGIIIPPGQNINFIPGTTSIDIYYGSGTNSVMHTDINANFDYTISPGANGWILTLDK